MDKGKNRAEMSSEVEIKGEVVGGVSRLGRVAIVGSGAVGSYYGARLLEAGEDVHFLLRGDYDQVSQYGLKVTSVAGDFELKNVPCARSAEEIGPVDLVIVAWKATANEVAKEVLPPLLHKGTAILTLQNGLGNAEYYADLFGAERVLAGLCFVCINRLSPGVIHHSASGLIRVGEFSPERAPVGRLALIEAAFQRANVPCEAVAELEKALWMKLVWNFPFNGYSIAKGGVDTRVLLEELGMEDQLREVMAEVVACAAALGHVIPDGFINHQIAITKPMGGYRPSSMIDYVEGRPVEVEAIWEQPVKVAHAVGVAVPRMEALLAEVRRMLHER